MDNMEDRTAALPPEGAKAITFDYKKVSARARASIDTDSNWLITMTDIMSLLLVFFIMYIVTERKEMAKKPEADKAMSVTVPAIKPVSAAEKIKDEMDSVIKNLDMERDVSVQAAAKGIIITMKERLTFRPAEANILRDSEPMLDNIADIIKRHPSFTVEISGHTDNIPIRTPLYPSNWELSVARATSVLKYFIQKQGIDPSRFYITGNAEQRPVVSNDSPEQRAQNRRVEIRLKESESLQPL